MNISMTMQSSKSMTRASVTICRTISGSSGMMREKATSRLTSLGALVVCVALASDRYRF